jgi:hypothetical protein
MYKIILGIDLDEKIIAVLQLMVKHEGSCKVLGTLGSLYLFL